MKKLFLVLFGCFTAISAAPAQENKEKEAPLSYELNHNGKNYTIQVGDIIHLGYGSNPYGSFMYLRRTEDALPKELAGKDAIVTKIKYIKLGDINRIMMKIKPAWVFWTDGIEQAIDKKEITGINNVSFSE